MGGSMDYMALVFLAVAFLVRPLIIDVLMFRHAYRSRRP